MTAVSSRGELAIAVCGGAAAAAVVLFATSRSWLVEVTARAAPLPDAVAVRTGASLAPALPALALVALAGAGALLATRGVPRQAVGVLLALVGLAESATALGQLARPGVRDGWVWLAALAGLAVTAAGVAVLLRSRGWPAMGSRYERAAPRVPAPSGEVDVWDAIDRGEDPTVR